MTGLAEGREFSSFGRVWAFSKWTGSYEAAKHQPQRPFNFSGTGPSMHRSLPVSSRFRQIGGGVVVDADR
jgi:hypothetical protein